MEQTLTFTGPWKEPIEVTVYMTKLENPDRVELTIPEFGQFGDEETGREYIQTDDKLAYPPSNPKQFIVFVQDMKSSQTQGFINISTEGKISYTSEKNEKFGCGDQCKLGVYGCTLTYLL